MRAEDGAKQVVGGLHVSHPVADGFVDGVFEGAAAAADGAHFGPQQLHAVDVGLLAGDVHFTHVDDTLQAEQGAGGGRTHAVLTRARFGHDATLAHALGQQCLAEGVVDLVRPGMVQIFPLEVDLGAAKLLAQSFGVADGRRPSHIAL